MTKKNVVNKDNVENRQSSKKTQRFIILGKGITTHVAMWKGVKKK